MTFLKFIRFYCLQFPAEGLIIAHEDRQPDTRAHQLITAKNGAIRKAVIRPVGRDLREMLSSCRQTLEQPVLPMRIESLQMQETVRRIWCGQQLHVRQERMRLIFGNHHPADRIAVMLRYEQAIQLPREEQRAQFLEESNVFPDFLTFFF